ncbi:unnamed protein product [Schistosoma turkestanicum]|nr:unnamed protein product [Schistosoma turkestanicum]
MFAIDYEATFLDHKRITVCLSCLGSNSDEETFDSVYCSLVTHYSFTFVRSGGSKNERVSDMDKRNSLSDASEVHSDIGISSFNTRQPIWLRFLKEYNPINNAWSCFQPYRATVGLLAFAWCSSYSDVESNINDYIKQKELLSTTLISSQLFLLLKSLSDINNSLSVEEVDAFVSEKLKKDSVLRSEITCHPSEHLFASEMIILKDFGYSAGTDECSSVVDKPQSSIRPPFINHRISSVLQGVISEIYWNLKKTLAAKCPNDIKLKKKESQLSKEQTDSSDDLLMAPEENESKWNILDEVKRKALGRTHTLSALSAFTERTGSTSSVSAQADIRYIKQKRATGRFRKYLGDVFLQLSDLEMAQIQYNLAIEHLKPINDTLWIAGALEGLCAVAMCQHSSDHSSVPSTMRSKFLHQRHLDDLTNGELRKSHSQELDVLEHSTSGLDLASSKPHQNLIISSNDCCNYALETIELYQKVELNPYLFEEFKFKVVRLLISESRKRKACEILDSLIGPSLSSFNTENPCSLKRYLTIVRLYKSMNFNRKASLALWLLSSLNRLNHIEFENEILLNGLKIQSAYSPNITQMIETKLVNGNDNTITNSTNNNISNNKDLTCLLNENQPPVSIAYRLISNPPLWSPFVVLDQSHWLTRLTTTIPNSTILSTSTFNNIIKLKSMANITRLMNPSTNSNMNNLYSSKSCLLFRPIGWCDLQLKVMLYLIDEYKVKINLEDISEISWDIGLKLIGYCFSVLDSWPEYTEKTSCITCMDDLCRLAVLRCSDQPTNLPIISLVNYYTGENVHLRRWPRNRRVVYSSNGFCYTLNNDNDEVRMKVFEKKMLDLIEIPVHQLPLVRVINIPSLPSHLLPQTISNNGAENIVSLSKTRTVVIRSDHGQPKATESNNCVESSKSTGPFVYNPFQIDNSGGNKHPVIDWICEEPGFIELIVDNKLPIDLRISDLHIELIPVNVGLSSKETSSNRVSSLTSDYESLFGLSGCTGNNGCSDITSSFIDLEAISLIVETSQSVKILPTTQLDNVYLENMKHQTAKLDLTIYPYETRWLPIELYIRDENRVNVSINRNNIHNSDDNNNNFDDNYSIKRNLNLLHVDLKSASISSSLLTKLNLTPTDFVQCIGLEDIRKSFPLPVENSEVPNSLLNINSDYDERFLPLYATYVGLIWLKFDSDKYWQIITNRLSTDFELNELIKSTEIQSIYIELEIEYALDAIKPSSLNDRNSTSSLLLNNNNNNNHNQSLARRISLGFKLELLSSNLAPLKLTDLMLTFEDEPLINEFCLPKHKQMIKLFGEKIQTESFLYGSVETNLSHTFLPQISIKSDHLPHYRLEVELKENWSDQQQSTSPVQIISPWLCHVSPELSDSSFKRKQSLSSTELTKTISETTSSSSTSSVTNSYAEDALDNLKTAHQIRLPLIGFSDLVFNNQMTKLVNLEHLKSNEIGIPIPVKSEVPGSVLESNVKIFWSSRVQARWVSDCKLEKSQPYEKSYLCSYFRRYGRIILFAHECRIDPKWFINEASFVPLFKPWYTYPFLNSGSAAGLLWSNNIWIDMSLDPPVLDNSSNGRINSQRKLDPQSQLCLQCRQDYSIARRTTVCTQRRISSISVLLNQELLTNVNANDANLTTKNQSNNLKTEESSSSSSSSSSLEHRKISMPDLRASHKSTLPIDNDDLHSSSRICTYLFNPVSISIRCGIRHNFLQNICIKNETSDSTTQLMSQSSNSIDTTDSTQEFRIERVWMGPAVYRHVQHIGNDEYGSTQSTLLGPLIEGIDYVFVGKASGSIGVGA